MKFTNQIYILLLVCFIISACEDVVDIELDEFEPELVFDAWVTDMDEPQVITLSQTQNFFNADETPRINEAVVNLTRDDGVVFPFAFTENGRYVYDPASNGILGVVGNSFELNVDIGGVSFCASSTINRVPVIDSIGVEFREEDLFSDEGFFTQFFARDFVGQGDAYWIQTFKNGEFRNNPRELNIAFDAGFDGGSGVDGIVFISPIRELINPMDENFAPIPWEPTDTARVEIHSISQDAFQFLEIARDQITNGDNGIFALPVANTRSNILNCTSEEALVIGFFNVAAVTTESRVIQE